MVIFLIKFAFVQAPLEQTSNQQSDSNYEHNSDIFKSPDGKIICAGYYTPKNVVTPLGSDLSDFEVEITARVLN